jgi:hypothetical protein
MRRAMIVDGGVRATRKLVRPQSHGTGPRSWPTSTSRITANEGTTSMNA